MANEIETKTTDPTTKPAPEPAVPDSTDRIDKLEKRCALLENTVEKLMGAIAASDKKRSSGAEVVGTLLTAPATTKPDARRADYKPEPGSVRAKVGNKGAVKIHQKTFHPGDTVMVPPDLIDELASRGLVVKPDGK